MTNKLSTSLYNEMMFHSKISNLYVHNLQPDGGSICFQLCLFSRLVKLLHLDFYTYGTMVIFF